MICSKCGQRFVHERCYNCEPVAGPPSVYYHIQLDDKPVVQMPATCLADLCDKVRHQASRVRVWSPVGLQLIDTNYGDNYCLIKQ